MDALINHINYIKLRKPHAIAYRLIRLESLKNYPNSFGARYEDALRQEKMGYESYIEEDHPDNFIIGAFSQEALIGICGFYRMTDTRCCHRGNIIQMYVKPEFQKKGIGFTLLKATVEEAFLIQGIEQIELGVMSNNLSAIKIYENLGFKVFGTEKNSLKVDGGYIDLHQMVLFK